MRPREEANGSGKKVENLELYDRGFNEVIVAAGASVTKLQQLSHRRVKKFRGQNVYFSMKYEKGTAGIPHFPILAGKYVVPCRDGEAPVMLAGTTFEYDVTTMDGPADLKKATCLLEESLRRVQVPRLDSSWIPQQATVSGSRPPFVRNFPKYQDQR